MSEACRRKALDLLARRAHFRRELGDKLLRRDFPAPAVEAVLDVLETEGLLDDRRAAREMATGSLTRKGYGPLRVRAELERRGAPASAVDEALVAAFPDGDREAAQRAAARWLAHRHFDRDRLGRHLGARGFAVGTIRDTLRWAADRAPERDGR